MELICLKVHPTNACGCMISKYLDQKGWAVLLAAKKSVGITPEVNLRNPLHTGNKAHQQGIHTESKNRGISGSTKGLYFYFSLIV